MFLILYLTINSFIAKIGTNPVFANIFPLAVSLFAGVLSSISVVLATKGFPESSTASSAAYPETRAESEDK